MMETEQKQTLIYLKKMKQLKNIYINVMVYLVMGKEIMQYNRIKGNYINVGYIDTAIVIIPFNLCKNIK